MQETDTGDPMEQLGEVLIDDVVRTNELRHRVGDQLQGVVAVDALAGFVVDDPDRAVPETHQRVAAAGVAETEVEDLELRAEQLRAGDGEPVEVLPQPRRDVWWHLDR